jgi:hypothetical protein
MEGAATADASDEMRDDLVSEQIDKFVLQAVDQLSSTGHDVNEENPSYALLEMTTNIAPALSSTSSSSAVTPHRCLRRNSSSVANHVPSTDSAHGTKKDMLPWSVCHTHIDERVRTLNWQEVEMEEEQLSQLLSAVHGRKLLLQILRLTKRVRE